MDDGLRQEFLELLSNTSRSFSVGIMGLDQPLRDEVCLGYLLCRIFDTYEDSVSIPAGLRLNCLSYSARLLENLDNPAQLKELLKDWVNVHEFEAAWTADQHAEAWEHKLLLAGDRVWTEVGALGLGAREAFRKALGDMVAGMSREVSERQLCGNRRARTIAETDAYCYSVAGTVGHLLTDLFSGQGAFGGTSVDVETAREGVEFGKALQLVNIMKDFHKDWREGRCYWPALELPAGKASPLEESASLEEVFQQLRAQFQVYLTSAQAYIRRIDSSRKDLRFFCEFPLRMAVATLDRASADMSWLSSGGTFKVDRMAVANIVNELIS